MMEDSLLKETYPKFLGTVVTRILLVTCEPLLTFLDLIYSNSVRGSRKDKLYWKPAKGRGFKVGGYLCSLMPTIVVFSMEDYLAIEGTT